MDNDFNSSYGQSQGDGADLYDAKQPPYHPTSPKSLGITSKEGFVPYFDTVAVADDTSPLDNSWVKIAFMVPNSEISDDVDVANRYYTSARSKFTDTRLGGNIGINPRPQWTPYADIRHEGRLPSRNPVVIGSALGNYGMGSAYSEAIDDPSQKIFMRFGVPNFNSIVGFMLNAFDRETSILARTGRAPNAWYTCGRVVGNLLVLNFFPVLSVAIWAGKLINNYILRPTSKFFTLKSAMHVYWNSVNVLVMSHAVRTGLIKKVMGSDETSRLGSPYKLDTREIEILEQMFPDIFHNGRFDVLRIASRTQALANKQFAKDYERLSSDDAGSMEGYLKQYANVKKTSHIANDGNEPTLSAMFNHLLMVETWLNKVKSDDESTKQDIDPRIDPNNPISKPGEIKPRAEASGYATQMDATFRDGMEFACFRVDHTGSIQEAFGNSVGESGISQSMNSTSSQIREARFNLAEGNIFDGTLKKVQDAVTSTVGGVLDAVTFGFAGMVAGLAGSGYIDIPKHWQSSNVDLPRGSYTIKLISPYGNEISKFINIWIPFFMLIVGAAPRAIGKSSYTSPFYCQLFDRGRLQSKLGMIESLSITRGTSNLQFDTRGQVLAIDVTFNVVDLSSIMYLPISSGEIGTADVTMDDDNVTTDYLATLAGQDIYSQIYPWPKAQLKLTLTKNLIMYKLTSPAFHVSLFKNSIEDGFINDITLGASGLISNSAQAFVRGNALLEGTRD